MIKFPFGDFIFSPPLVLIHYQDTNNQYKYIIEYFNDFLNKRINMMIYIQIFKSKVSITTKLNVLNLHTHDIIRGSLPITRESTFVLTYALVDNLKWTIIKKSPSL